MTTSKKRVITGVQQDLRFIFRIRFQHNIAVGHLNSREMSTASKKIVAVADDNRVFASARITLFMKHSRLHD